MIDDNAIDHCLSALGIAPLSSAAAELRETIADTAKHLMRDSGASAAEIHLTWNVGVPMVVVRPAGGDDASNEYSG